MDGIDVVPPPAGMAAPRPSLEEALSLHGPPSPVTTAPSKVRGEAGLSRELLAHAAAQQHAVWDEAKKVSGATLRAPASPSETQPCVPVPMPAVFRRRMRR